MQVTCGTHRAYITIREALRQMSDRLSLSPCRRCGGPLKITGTHRYANLGAGEFPFSVIAAVADGPDGDRFEFYLAALRFDHGATHIQPMFWAPGQKGKMRYGQFSPLHLLETWERMFREMRVRLEGGREPRGGVQ